MPEISLFDRTFRAADDSPPVVQLAAGGLDVTAGAAVQALPANPARTFAARIQLTSGTGDLWVRYDGPDAVQGVGEKIVLGQQWYAPTTSAVSVLYVGSDAAHIATSEEGSA